VEGPLSPTTKVICASTALKKNLLSPRAKTWSLGWPVAWTK
jgi:hypothetical protein